MTLEPRPPALALALSLAALVAGCKCGKDKPYTPFGVASGNEPLPVPVPSASGAEAPPDAAAPGGFAKKRAAVAPVGATRWTLDGMALTAPEGRAFARGLVADFDADEKPEAVTWTVPKEGPGELWLHPQEGAPRRLATLPGFVPGGPTCKLESELTQTGPRTVTLDASASCEPALLARTPKRAIVVVAPRAERNPVLTLRVAEPAPGEVLGLDVDTSDKDGDGRDDVRLAVSVTKQGSKRSASAQLVWFDRASGVSRDATEPAASLARMASLPLARAKSKQNAESALELVGATRRLLGSLCAEGGVPRVFDGDGAPIACGKLGVTVDRLAMAELRAALTVGDVLAAGGALSRDGWYFGAASEKIRKEMTRALEGATTRVEATSTRPGARPTRETTAPRFSPLAFEPSGALLVQTGSGLVRIATDGTEQPLDADAAPESWPLEVVSDGGWRWSGVALACDRSEVLLSVQTGPGTPAAPPLVTDLLAPRPGACRGGAPPKYARPAPLAWKTTGLEAIVAGAHVGPKTSAADAALRPQPLGTPRSPDGRHLVVPTPIGLLVTGPKKPELWQTANLPEETALSDCAVASGAAAVACVASGQLLILRRP